MTSLNKLYPSFVVIDYTSEFGQHKQTLPTLQWTGTGLGDPGNFETHDAVGISALTMIAALVLVYKALLPTTTTLVSYTIYNMPTMTSIPQPVYTAALGVAGTDAALTGQAKATQWTMSIRTTAFGILKFVMLDRPNNDNWGNITTMDAASLALFNELSDAGNGWAGRDGGKPGGFMGISITLNKRLRRKYDMI
jgi:hypothetical protein